MNIWDLPYEPRLRVILNSDAACEADDQYAIVHALLSPSLDIRGIIAAHFGDRKASDSMRQSRREIDLLVELLGKTGTVRVEDGAPHMLPDIETPVDSPGAQLIIAEAMREGCGPLAIGFQGPLTDMASALILEPRIAERDVTVIWIGGDPYDRDGKTYSPEYNLSNDVNAANVVFASSTVVWQVPMSTYVTMGVSYAELFEHVRPCGKLGEYLVDHLVEFNRANPTRRGAAECRSLGDSPVVGLMLNADCGWWSDRPAPGFDASFGYDMTVQHRPIRVYRSIETRFIIGDFFAKLRAFSQLADGAR